jgi:hypothetical protein
MKPKINRVELRNKLSDKFETPTEEDLMYEEIWLEKIFGKLQIKDLIKSKDLFRISEVV